MIQGLEEIDIDRSSYVDPNGFVFRYKGDFYRAIYRNVADFYRGLFENGTINTLISQHHLVSTEISEIQLPQPDVALVLKHEKIEPISYCTEWCPSMLQSAGLALLDLELAILGSDCLLQDCYPWNVLFRGTEPVIVDFTSIVKAESSLIWPAFEQYRAFFVRSLQLCLQGKGKVARYFISNNISGISVDDLIQASTTTFKLFHPSLLFEKIVDNTLQKKPDMRIRLRQNLEKSKPPSSDVRRHFFSRLRKKLANLKFPKGIDAWSNYYQQIGPQIDRKKKLDSIDSILNEHQPASVVDLGCNTGVFSIIAAKKGARVIAIDSSEACIESLFQTAREDRLPITPLISDLFCPTPPSGFLAKQYPGLLERVESELAMCLGLMHHLHITGRQSLPRIAELVHSVAKERLIFEYVAQDDDNNVLLGAGRPIHYTLDDVKKCLNEYFSRIEVLDSDRPTRKLLVCAR
ncbi:MAG: hypothetical protein C5B54_11550 [Acidobacteria bacterium]|nr:MAG: hypothetical protein C5B54_11550 [Acidobacteriota bacterium]